MSRALFLALGLLTLLSFVPLFSCDMRTWPNPPIPKQVFEGDFEGITWQDVVNPWRNYLIYIALVFFVPLLLGLFLCITSCICCFCRWITIPCQCCSRKCCKIPKLPLRFCGLLPYSFGYAVVLVCTILGVVFFLWFFVGWIDVRQQSFKTAKDNLDLPDNVVESVDEIAGVVPKILDRFGLLVDESLDLGNIINTTNSIINDTKNGLEGVQPHLDANYQYFKNIESTVNNMKSYTSGDFGSVDLSQFSNEFANASTAITTQATSALDEAQTIVNDAFSQVNQVTEGFTTQISEFNDTITNQIDEMTDMVDELMDEGKKFYEDYVNRDALDQYETYVKIGEGVFGFFVIVVLSLVAVIMTCGFLCVFGLLSTCLRCLNCCTCCCILPYTIVAAICLLLWCLTIDICNQAEGYPAKFEEQLDLPQFQIPSIAPGQEAINITIKFSEAAMGILKCPTDSNFLDASGLSLDTFGIPAFIDSYKGIFTDQLDTFNVDDFINNGLSQFNSFTNNLNISKTAIQSSNSMKSEITKVVTDYFAIYPMFLTLSDFETETAQFSRLNVIVQSAGGAFATKHYTGTNITLIAPSSYSTTPTATTGDMVTVGFTGGADYGALSGSGLSAQLKNELWGTLGGFTGSIEKGLVYNLTRMNAASPLNSGRLYDDYQKILTDFDNLAKSLNATEEYTVNLFDVTDEFEVVSNLANQTVLGIIDDVFEFVDWAIDETYDTVKNSSILECGFIGDFYRTARNSYCSNVKTALGGTSVSAIIMFTWLFVFFLIIMCLECTAQQAGNRRKKKSKAYFDD